MDIAFGTTGVLRLAYAWDSDSVLANRTVLYVLSPSSTNTIVRSLIPQMVRVWDLQRFLDSQRHSIYLHADISAVTIISVLLLI